MNSSIRTLSSVWMAFSSFGVSGPTCVWIGELLDLPLAPEAIDFSAGGVSQFVRRYGFRDQPQRIRFRLLDRRLSPLAGDPEQDIARVVDQFCAA